MISARRKRHLFLLLLALTGFVGGIPVSRLLDQYRGIVLEQQGDRMLVAYLDRMPRWRKACDAVPGDIVAKPRLAWHGQKVEALGKDMVLKQLYERYQASYDATVVRLEKPEFVGAPAYMIVDTTQGRRLRIPTPVNLEPPLAEGNQIRKYAKAWDPVRLGTNL